jgi:hypothetical protein
VKIVSVGVDKAGNTMVRGEQETRKTREGRLQLSFNRPPSLFPSVIIHCSNVFSFFSHPHPSIIATVLPSLLGLPVLEPILELFLERNPSILPLIITARLASPTMLAFMNLSPSRRVRSLVIIPGLTIVFLLVLSFSSFFGSTATAKRDDVLQRRQVTGMRILGPLLGQPAPQPAPLSSPTTAAANLASPVPVNSAGQQPQAVQPQGAGGLLGTDTLGGILGGGSGQTSGSSPGSSVGNTTQQPAPIGVLPNVGSAGGDILPDSSLLVSSMPPGPASPLTTAQPSPQPSSASSSGGLLGGILGDNNPISPLLQGGGSGNTGNTQSGSASGPALANDGLLPGIVSATSPISSPLPVVGSGGGVSPASPSSNGDPQTGTTPGTTSANGLLPGMLPPSNPATSPLQAVGSDTGLNSPNAGTTTPQSDTSGTSPNSGIVGGLFPPNHPLTAPLPVVGSGEGVQNTNSSNQLPQLVTPATPSANGGLVGGTGILPGAASSGAVPILGTGTKTQPMQPVGGILGNSVAGVLGGSNPVASGTVLGNLTEPVAGSALGGIAPALPVLPNPGTSPLGSSVGPGIVGLPSGMSDIDLDFRIQLLTRISKI